MEGLFLQSIDYTMEVKQRLATVKERERITLGGKVNENWTTRKENIFELKKKKVASKW